MSQASRVCFRSRLDRLTEQIDLMISPQNEVIAVGAHEKNAWQLFENLLHSIRVKNININDRIDFLKQAHRLFAFVLPSSVSLAGKQHSRTQYQAAIDKQIKVWLTDHSKQRALPKRVLQVIKAQLVTPVPTQPFTIYCREDMRGAYYLSYSALLQNRKLDPTELKPQPGRYQCLVPYFAHSYEDHTFQGVLITDDKLNTLLRQLETLKGHLLPYDRVRATHQQLDAIAQSLAVPAQITFYLRAGSLYQHAGYFTVDHRIQDFIDSENALNYFNRGLALLKAYDPNSVSYPDKATLDLQKQAFEIALSSLEYQIAFKEIVPSNFNHWVNNTISIRKLPDKDSLQEIHQILQQIEPVADGLLTRQADMARFTEFCPDEKNFMEALTQSYHSVGQQLRGTFNNVYQSLVNTLLKYHHHVETNYDACVSNKDSNTWQQDFSVLTRRLKQLIRHGQYVYARKSCALLQRKFSEQRRPEIYPVDDYKKIQQWQVIIQHSQKTVDELMAIMDVTPEQPHFPHSEHWPYLTEEKQIAPAQQGVDTPDWTKQLTPWLTIEKKTLGKRQIFIRGLTNKQPVTELQATYTAEIKKALAAVFAECEIFLGPAPCGFHVIGLGSLSRNELSPCSDLDMAILIDRDHIEDQSARAQLRHHPYFQSWLHLLRARLGFLPDHCLVIDGRDIADLTTDIRPLLNTPHGLANYVIELAKKDAKAIGGYSARRVESIYASQSQSDANDTKRSAQLCEVYQAQLQQSFNAPQADGVPLYRIVAQQCLGETLYADEKQKNQLEPGIENKATLNFKARYLKPLTYWCFNIARYFGIHETHTQVVLARLREHVITGFIDAVQQALETIHRLRVQAHLDYLAHKPKGLKLDEFVNPHAQLSAVRKYWQKELSYWPADQAEFVDPDAMDKIHFEEKDLETQSQAIPAQPVILARGFLYSKERIHNELAQLDVYESKDFPQALQLEGEVASLTDIETFLLETIHWSNQALSQSEKEPQDQYNPWHWACQQVVAHLNQHPDDEDNIAHFTYLVKILIYRQADQATYLDYYRKLTHRAHKRIFHSLCEQCSESKAYCAALAHEPEVDGWRLEIEQTRKQWYQSILDNLLDPYSGEEKRKESDVLIETTDLSLFAPLNSRNIKKYIFKPGAYNAIVDAQGALRLKPHRQPGRHTVLPIPREQPQFWLKLLPEQAGTEYIVSELIASLCGVGVIPPGLIIKIHYQNQAFVAYLMPHVTYKTSLAASLYPFTDHALPELATAALREQAQTRLSHIHPLSFVKQLIRVLLTNPEDDHDQDYLLVKAKQGEDYDLVRIDNERAFFTPLQVNQGWFGTKQTLQVKSILYCLNSMQTTRLTGPEVDKQVAQFIQQFLSLKPYPVLEQWLSQTVANTHIFLTDLFTPADIEYHTQLHHTTKALSVLTIPIPKGLSKRLFNSFTALQAELHWWINHGNTLNGIHLLLNLHPSLKPYYHTIFDTHPVDASNPARALARFKQLTLKLYDWEVKKHYRAHGPSLKSSVIALTQSLQLEAQITTHDIFAVVNTEKLSYVQAKKELRAISEKIFRNSLPQLTQAILACEPFSRQAFLSLSLQHQRQLINYLLAVNREVEEIAKDSQIQAQHHKRLTTRQQQFLLSLIELIRLHDGRFLKHLSPGLTENLMTSVIRNSQYTLRALDLSGWQELNDSMVRTIAQTNVLLEQLTLKNHPKLTRIAWRFSNETLAFPQLKQFTVENCLQLGRIHTCALQLKKLNIINCPELAALTTENLPWNVFNPNTLNVYPKLVQVEGVSVAVIREIAQHTSISKWQERSNGMLHLTKENQGILWNQFLPLLCNNPKLQRLEIENDALDAAGKRIWMQIIEKNPVISRFNLIEKGSKLFSKTKFRIIVIGRYSEHFAVIGKLLKITEHGYHVNTGFDYKTVIVDHNNKRYYFKCILLMDYTAYMRKCNKLTLDFWKRKPGIDLIWMHFDATNKDTFTLACEVFEKHKDILPQDTQKLLIGIGDKFQDHPDIIKFKQDMGIKHHLRLLEGSKPYHEDFIRDMSLAICRGDGAWQKKIIAESLKLQSSAMLFFPSLRNVPPVIDAQERKQELPRPSS